VTDDPSRDAADFAEGVAIIARTITAALAGEVEGDRALVEEALEAGLGLGQLPLRLGAGVLKGLAQITVTLIVQNAKLLELDPFDLWQQVALGVARDLETPGDVPPSSSE